MQKSKIPWCWKISEIKAELQDQISLLTWDGEVKSSSLSSASQICKKVLDTVSCWSGREISLCFDWWSRVVFFLFLEISVHFPLQWWKANSLRYPCLSQLVKPLFAIPRTSRIRKSEETKSPPNMVRMSHARKFPEHTVYPLVIHCTCKRILSHGRWDEKGGETEEKINEQDRLRRAQETDDKRQARFTKHYYCHGII